MSANLFKMFDGAPDEFEGVKGLFTCSSCGRDVMRGGRYIAQVQDSMVFCGCACLTVAFFDLERACPDSKRWRNLIKLAKKRDVEMIVLGPGRKGGRGYGNN
jgi:hypothetical protein